MNRKDRKTSSASEKQSAPDNSLNEGMNEAIQSETQKDKAQIWLFLRRLIIFVTAMVLLFGVVFQIKVVANDDMKPAMRIGDLELVYCLPAKRKMDSVICYQKNGQLYNGRIVAEPGQSVEIRDDVLYVDGAAINNPNIYFSTPAYEGNLAYPLNLGADEYFVLCDYRLGGFDSRNLGVVQEKEIVGNVITILRRSQI